MTQVSRRKFLGKTFAGTAAIAAAPLATAANAAGLYKPGTYAAKAPGIGGDVIVKMTFDANKITDVVIDASTETPGIGQKAMRLKAHRCKHPEMFSAPSQMIHCIKNSRRLICALGRADDIPIPQGIQCFLYSYPFCPIFRLIAIHFIFLHIFVSAVQP